MLPTALAAAGGLLIVAVFIDALMTTLSVSAGAGPFTSRVLSGGWRLVLKAHVPGHRSRLLGIGGAAMLILTVVIWVALLWAGWSLVFLASDATVYGDSKSPAAATDVVYFSGMTLFTLGTGDVVVASKTWRLVSAVSAFTGLFLVTLAITYLVSVIAAVVARRALAINIRALGSDAHQIVLGGWHKEGFAPTFQQQLVSLTPLVTTSAEHHLAYPVLHYFHSADPAVAAPLQLAHLDDALILLDQAVLEEARPDRAATQPLSFAVRRYVATVTGIAWIPSTEPPPQPDKDRLLVAGIPLSPSYPQPARDEFSVRHRSRLHALVIRDGWRWQS